jgi:hypothetical protein
MAAACRPLPLAGPLLAGLLAITAMAMASVAHADGAASWRFAPAQAPPAPAGTPAAPYALPVGEVGELSFWAPNRGLLITGGTEDPWGGSVSPGLYAYDGVDWHQLSTVCGGGSGRIAWAGPDDFWTIADQRGGQLLSAPQSAGELKSISLCHFLDGAVVGSYAMPLQQAGSYLAMDAAACLAPSDCWFGGQDGAGGAFHLHWDGSSVTVVYEPAGFPVSDMVAFEGSIYQSVQIQGFEASPSNPALIHTIAPAGSSTTFNDVFMFAGRPLPEYGRGVAPAALQGLSLGTDGSPLGEGATQLWGAANPVLGSALPRGANAGALTVLRYAGGSWSQIVPNTHGESPLPSTVELSGTASTQVTGGPSERGASGAIAPEPGSESAWVSLFNTERRTDAELALLNADGTLAGPPEELPGPQDPVGFRGVAGPITCPAQHDCWMATNAGRDPVTGDQSVPGWLFHLTDGTVQTPNADPLFDGSDGVISYRPPDSGVPVIYPDVPPIDNSLANQQPPAAPSAPPAGAAAATAPKVKSKPLVEHIKSVFLHHRVLVISFTLTARAHVQLIARHKRQVVAKTANKSLRSGRHELSLSLNPAHWPTGLQFKATPVGATAPSGGPGPTTNTISTG